eukprot:c13786_g1_i1.p1 GENE.c13786_g1_i1~~c13786_g1_i1.p1  ORF type:complete len:241 (-),score=52.66 c13786_g1_i1:82-804(-)
MASVRSENAVKAAATKGYLNGEFQDPPPLRILVVGGSSVGKSSIVRRFVSNKFVPQHNPTIVSDFVLGSGKSQDQDKAINVPVLFVDVSSAELKGGHLATLLASIEGILLVTSLCDPKSPQHTEQWLLTLRNLVGDIQCIPSFIAANKTDEKKQQLLTASSTAATATIAGGQAVWLTQLCEMWGVGGWGECSALTGEGVHECVLQLLHDCLRVRTHQAQVAQTRHNLLSQTPPCLALVQP